MKKMKKYDIYLVNCDCASMIMVKRHTNRGYLLGPKCPGCKKTLGSMEYMIGGTVMAPTSFVAEKIYRASNDYTVQCQKCGQIHNPGKNAVQFECCIAGCGCGAMGYSMFESVRMRGRRKDQLTDEQCEKFRRLPCSFNDMVRRIYEAGREAERERCCGIIFGQCGSDNVAQRTVNAIRELK